ncbi:MAG: DNA mismatch repair endonuclease MutL [Pseudomonadota bacterium]
MDVIRILSEKVAAQIAAGEVIERPSSVTRELLDNSIDAGSDRITIRIEKGGIKLIRVSDNGMGMSRDDLLLCLERHATSKISSLSDLFSIKTLGFRGEALPSISSVSRMELTSRPAGQIIGYKLKVEGGILKSIDEAGTPEGTIIEVRDLFFNVPARRKFLRAIKTETDHIIDTVSRIALPFIPVHFRLDDSHQKTVLNLPASENELNRLTALMGRHVSGSMIEIYQETEDFVLKGFITPPDLNRSRGDRIYIYINKRNVRDKLITRAVMQGYGQRLMRGRYPYVVLFVEIDPTLVDVNVHPTKQEVRFQRGHIVYQTIVATIERSLGRQPHPFMDARYPSPIVKEEMRFTQMVMAEQEWDYSGPIQMVPEYKEKDWSEEPAGKEALHIIGQLNNTYILCQSNEALLMIDQHAAHERIVYEALKGSSLSSPSERQLFLLPYRLELPLKDGRVLQGNLDKLLRLGLEFEHFGGSTFILRSAPSILLDVEWENFLSDLIPLLEDEPDIDSKTTLDKLLTTMACHGAIRAGHRMSQEEMVGLLNQLKEMNLPTHCPHGRPIYKRFTFYEIEKMFKRVL